MKIYLFSWLFLIPFSLNLLGIGIVSVSGQCLADQQSILIELSKTLKFNSSLSTKIATWNRNTDCCSWKGVNCSRDGHVIALDLSDELICGGIENSSPLFSLKSLQSLNLAYNRFDSLQIPPEIGNLTNLEYLNLSHNGFTGQIPGELSRMTRLVILDLSFPFSEEGSLKLENPNLERLIQNLTELTELYLDGVNISAQGYSWSKAISSSLPKLKVLSLSGCFLSGPIDASFAKLRSLSVLRLADNNLSGPVQWRTSTFDPPGRIPSAMANLSQIVYLDLSSNEFVGPIPSFQKSENLTYLDLSYNGLNGSIPSSNFEGQVNLGSIDLSHNAFSGQIPSSLFSLPLLRSIQLSHNNFGGLLATFLNSPFSELDTLDLSSNKLEGPVPKSIFYLTTLNFLSLSYNHLNGTIRLEAFKGLRNLAILDLSYNNLSVETGGENSSSSVLPQFSTLNLASCKLQSFPNLKNQSWLIDVDLSSNEIGGEIPNWIWNVGNGDLKYLNLSCNRLGNFQQPFEIPSGLNYLDLHSNHLQEDTLKLPASPLYVDYSANQFNCSLPVDIGSNLSVTYFFSVSNNSITGTIPESICNALHLQVLDLSNNDLNGTIPPCLVQLTMSLEVLNLGKNKLSGNIPRMFGEDCGLETLDLNGNHLEGSVPKSLASCTMLKVLNLGNNRIKDTFPCFLKNNTYLRVLVLRSNKFQGVIGCGAGGIWPKLQIIDIASNNFTGHVPPKYFLTWRNMVNGEDGAESKLRHLGVKVINFANFDYLDSVTVTNKGLPMELLKILTIFTSIDISDNSFSGEIPDAIGDLKELYVLNVSHNAFTGPIPRSIGNMRQLGSLDFSVNNLSGRIPAELVQLTFLSFLNLSYNQLEGRIPESSQLETFTETSFEGNKGLCGFQLNISCNNPQTPSEEDDQKDDESIVDIVSVEVGFIVGLATFIASLVFCKRWSIWYYKHVEQTVVAKVYWYYERRKRERRNRERRERERRNRERRNHIRRQV